MPGDEPLLRLQDFRHEYAPESVVEIADAGIGAGRRRCAPALDRSRLTRSITYPNVAPPTGSGAPGVR